MASELVNTCSTCGAEESLSSLLFRMIEDNTVRRMLADLVTTTLPAGGQIVRYLQLFKPPRQKLRLDRVAKVLAELVPDVTARVIERDGRHWAVNDEMWITAVGAVFTAVGKGTLAVPLPDNRYLYSVLLRLAEKAASAAEVAREEERRAGPRAATVTVAGESMSIGDALGVVYRQQDPALQKIRADSARAVPVPDHVRALRERIASEQAGGRGHDA